jgi:hypothetical protein
MNLYQRKASMSFGIEVSAVMEKGKWMFESEVSIKPRRVT